MLMVQVIIASVSVLYKVAINDGTSVSVLTAYRLIFAELPLFHSLSFLKGC
jgi:hypothetical protein